MTRPGGGRSFRGHTSVLEVREDRTALLTCEDGNGNRVFCKMIEYTDFPLVKIAFYVTGNTILLPSEY